jgi:hypothetical protein
VLRPLRLALAALALALPVRAADEPPAVDLALVLAVDVSESVNDERYELQHEGIARAFESAQLADAVGARPAGAIEVLVLEWSDRDKQMVTVDWTRIGDAGSAKRFAERVRATQRSSNGVTAIGDALLAARAALDHAPFPAERRVIDLSGDGMANMGPPPAGVRDALIAQGITINGLAILAEEPWLDGYYDMNVIGGAGAFLVVAETFDAFAAAILNKLLGEIAGVPPTGQNFASISPSPPPVRVGERVGVRGPVTRPAP